MKRKISAITTLLAFVIANAMSFAETPECLSRTYNRVTGIAAGDTASVQTWDFRDVVAEKRGIARVVYNESDSLISVLQDGNTLRYRIDRDTVFFIGQRNRGIAPAGNTLRFNLLQLCVRRSIRTGTPYEPKRRIDRRHRRRGDYSAGSERHGFGS